MKNSHAWGLMVGPMVVAMAGACGSSPASVEETTSDLNGSRTSIAVCCHRAFWHKWQRGRCMAEAAHGRGVCGHWRPHDGGACDAAPGGAGGMGGEAGVGGETGAGGAAGDSGVGGTFGETGGSSGEG